jgi:hypothetical protein
VTARPVWRLKSPFCPLALDSLGTGVGVVPSLEGARRQAVGDLPFWQRGFSMW